MKNGWRAAIAPLLGALLGAVGAGTLVLVPPPLFAFGAYVVVLALTLVYGPVRAESAGARWIVLGSVAVRGLILGNYGMPVWGPLVVSQGLGRALMVLLGYVSRPAGESAGVVWSRKLSWPVAGLAGLQGLALCLIWGDWRLMFLLVAASLFTLTLGQRMIYRWRGGVNSDGLAVFEVVAEVVLLAAFVWNRIFTNI